MRIGFVSTLILHLYPKVTVNVTCFSSKFIQSLYKLWFISLVNINKYDPKMIFYLKKKEKEVTNLL
mgnify:CR=1 FL=1